MATKKESLKQSKQSILMGMVIATAMSAGFYVYWYTPANKEVEFMRSKVESEERALQTVRTQAPLLKPMTEKVKWLEQQLEVFRAKIAAKGEVVSLIKTIEEEAQRLGLKVKNMHTKTEAPPPPPTDKSSSAAKDATPVQPAYAKIILDTHMHADYYKLEDFLATLQN